MHILKWIVGLLLTLLVGGAAFVGILLVTAPDPASIEGPVEGWSLAQSMPSPRGELATAVAHVAPCQDPPCPERERLHVVGGLGGSPGCWISSTSTTRSRGNGATVPPFPAPGTTWPPPVSAKPST